MENTVAKKHPLFSKKFGAIAIAVWENQGKTHPFRTVSISRSYKKNNDDKWHDMKITGLSEKDMANLLAALKCAEEAMNKPVPQ